MMAVGVLPNDNISEALAESGRLLTLQRLVLYKQHQWLQDILHLQPQAERIAEARVVGDSNLTVDTVEAAEHRIEAESLWDVDHATYPEDSSYVTVPGHA